MSQKANSKLPTDREVELSEALLQHGVTAVPPKCLQGYAGLASRACHARNHFLKDGKGTAVETAEVISRAVRLHSLDSSLRTVGLPAEELLQESYCSKRFACKRCTEFVRTGALANVTSFVAELREERISRRMALDAALQAQHVTLADASNRDHPCMFDLDQFLNIGVGNVVALANKIAASVREDSLHKVGLSPDVIERDPRARNFIAGKGFLQSPKSLAAAVLMESEQRKACLSGALVKEHVDLNQLPPRSKAKEAFDDFVASGDISHVAEQAVSITRTWRREAMIRELSRQRWSAAHHALERSDFSDLQRDIHCSIGSRLAGASGELDSDVKETMRQFILGQRHVGPVLATAEELVTSLLAERKARKKIADMALMRCGFCVDSTHLTPPQAYHSFIDFNQGNLEEVMREFGRACRSQEVCQELRKKRHIMVDLFPSLRGHDDEDARIALYINGDTTWSSALELVHTIGAERNARSAELNGLLISAGLPSVHAACMDGAYNVRSKVQNVCRDYIKHGKNTAKAVVGVVDSEIRRELLIHEFRNFPEEDTSSWVQALRSFGNPIKQYTNYSMLCLKVALGTSRSFPRISPEVMQLIGSFDSSEQIRAFMQLNGEGTAETAKRLVATLGAERSRRREELKLDISASDLDFPSVGLPYEVECDLKKYIDRGVGCKMEIKAKVDAAYQKWSQQQRMPALRDALCDISFGLISVVKDCVSHRDDELGDDGSSESSVANVQARVDQNTSQAYVEILTSCAAFLRGNQTNLDFLLEEIKMKRNNRKKILDRELNADGVVRHAFVQRDTDVLDCLNNCSLQSTAAAVAKFVDLGLGSIERIVQHARSEIQMEALHQAIRKHGLDPHIVNTDSACVEFASKFFNSKAQIQEEADAVAESLKSARCGRYTELAVACQQVGVAVPELCGQESDFDISLASDEDMASDGDMSRCDPDEACGARSFVECNVGSSADVVCRILRRSRAESLKAALAQSNSVWKTWSARAISTWSRRNRQCQMFVKGCLRDLLTDTKIDNVEQFVELLEQQAGREPLDEEFAEPLDDSDSYDGDHDIGFTLGDMYPCYGCGDDDFDRMIEAYEDY